MAHRFLYRKHLKGQGNKGSGFFQVLAASGGVALAGALLLLVASVGGALGLYALIAQDLPSPDTLATREVARSTKILDRKGRLLYEMFDPQLGRRTTVPLKDISPYLIQATIATEDADFFENQGVNLRGILRAVWSNITQQRGLQGGSSITQQLVKNVLIAEEERTQLSLLRKVKEVMLSLELTRRYTKEQILEYYLNEIYYGNVSYGVESAAQSYFAKSARELDLAEAAMLAGLPQAPALYSPLVDRERAEQRQHAVLDLLVRQGFITQSEANVAKGKKLEYKSASFPIKAPHFVMYVQELLTEKYGARALYRTGYEVTTALDLDLQELGEELVRDQVEKTRNTINGHNAALVAIDPRTGEILAMVGSVDYFDSSIDGQVNIATAERQPGSTFKPFNYATAFMKGYTPATMLLDVPTTIRDNINPPYRPENFNKRFSGPVSVREALANSMNVPAIKTIEAVSIEAVLDTAHAMGITTLNRKGWYGLSLTLGGGEVKLLDLTYAFGTFANMGVMKGTPTPTERQRPGLRTVDPVAILKIVDSSGKVLEEYKEPQERRALQAEYAYLITHILSDNEARVPVFGSALRLPGGRPAGVKTGTTEDLRDFWTVGYTPGLVTGVWMGNANNAKLTSGFSGTTTAPIWEKFMAQALEGTPIIPFQAPPGIVTARVCVPSGLLPSPICPKTRQELFVRGQAPTQEDNLYKAYRIDKTTGKLATSRTPPENVEERVYLALPEDAKEWAKQNGIEQPPEEAPALPVQAGQPARSPDGGAAAPGRTAITAPAPGALVRGIVPVKGTIGGQGLEQYTLEIGQGQAPREWTVLAGPRKEAMEEGLLAALDTARFESGPYTLRLTVVRSGGSTEQMGMALTIDNVRPTVRIVTPGTNALLVMDGVNIKDVYGLQAVASDAFGVARVEFYVDGARIGSVGGAPYDFQWRLSPGSHSIFAVAVDRAGNSSQSEMVTVQVRASG
ncbi:MAG: PBP1A family penicillin-binding protein [Chloroflexi bacterium]|nr:PBP1A family penicillin-binding protein [Chloroflexota bacterium]